MIKAEPTFNLITALVTTWWTPVFVALFVAVLFYALHPRNRVAFDKAARLPLED
jgi:cytochrome c oxidase cbb3-type subunit IV